MREVKMKTTQAKAGGIRHRGKKYLIPENEAAALVRGGFAEYTIISPPEIAVIKPPEMEIIKPLETAKQNRKVKK